MKRLADFLINGRIPIFFAMLAFAGVCLFLMPHVNINKDMTKYLSDSSQMKQGLDLMDVEFPDAEDPHTIRLMLTDVPGGEKKTIRKEIEEIANVDTVSYKLDDSDYNKDNYTLYEITTDYDYGSDEETEIEKELAKKYAQFSPVVENLSNDVSLAPYLIISVAVVLVVILFIMSGSWFEPLLVLFVIGVSILVNMGSNFFLPSVSNTTYAIAAILQLVLSLDYSIILMNRYRQERAKNTDKVTAMKSAVASAFPSIVSSALTTFVGLLMLIFMQYRIGADLGVVLAKGVVSSLLCIFTMLPFLILLTDRILEKTKKPSLKIPMGGLAKFSNKARFVLPFIFAGLFITFFLLQRMTPISFDGTPDRQIAKIFPETNRVVVLYNNKDAEKISGLSDKIENLDGVSYTMDYTTTLARERTAEKMYEFLDDMEADVDMDVSDIKLMYYDYFKKGEAPSVRVGDLIHYINDELLPYEKYSKDMNDDIKENISTMVMFADTGELTKPRTFTQMLDFFRSAGSGDEDMSLEDMRLMYVYYYANVNSYEPPAMTPAEFVAFIRDDVAGDERFADYTDGTDFSQIDLLANYTDPEYITRQRDSYDMAAALSMDAEQAELLYRLYYGLPQAGSYTMTVTELLDYLQTDVAADPQFSGMFTDESMTGLAAASAIANVAASGQQLGFTDISRILGMDEEQASGIYMLYGMINGNPDPASVFMTLPEFLDFLTNSVLTGEATAAAMNSAAMQTAAMAAMNPAAFASMDPAVMDPAAAARLAASAELMNAASSGPQIDEAAAAALTQSAGLINAAAAGTPLDAASAAQMLDMDPSSMQLLYALRAGALTPDKTVSMVDMVDYILNEIAPDPTLGATFTDSNIVQMQQLSDIMNTALDGRALTFTEMGALLNFGDNEQLKTIFTMKDSKDNPAFGTMNVDEFVTLIHDKILPDTELSKDMTEERRKDFNSLHTIVKAIMSGKEYNSDELGELFASMSDEADADNLYLLTMLYGSMKDYDESWKLSLIELYNFIAEDVIKDPRFLDVLEEDTVKKVEESRADLDNNIDQLKGENYSLLIVETKLPYESEETYRFTDELFRLCDEELEHDNYKIGNAAMYKEMQASFGGEMLLITILTAASIFIIVAITFRNLLIPAILVLIVLCGVFITVAVSGMRGVSINYLANIIVQCILMGACIDYGILFTSYYRDKRKEKGIEESLKDAYDGSIHTVLTSGLIMVVVTGIIGFISTDPAVAPICLTLSIGSASAILLILFVLPGLLAAFDRIVRKKK